MASSVFNVLYELEQKLNKTINQVYDELTFRNGVDVPTTFDLEAGANTVAVEFVQGAGTANLQGRGATDIPLVQVNITKESAPVVMAVAGYSMTFSDERALTFANKATFVTDNSVLITRRAIDERLNTFAAYGDPILNAKGFYNNPNVTVTDSAFNPNTATYSQWVAFIVDLIIGFGTRNKTIPTHVFVSPNMIVRMAQVENADGLTVMEAIKKRLDAIDGYAGVRIQSRWESSSDYLERGGVFTGGTNKDRIVVFKKNPMVVARQMEANVAQMFPEKYSYNDGKGNMVYPMFSCSSATQFYDVSNVAYINTPKATP